MKMKVIILAGGFGTRLSEYTKTIPKPMIHIGGKPILFHIMKSYAKYGFKDFYVALQDKTDIGLEVITKNIIEEKDFILEDKKTKRIQVAKYHGSRGLSMDKWTNNEEHK